MVFDLNKQKQSSPQTILNQSTLPIQAIPGITSSICYSRELSRPTCRATFPKQDLLPEAKLWLCQGCVSVRADSKGLRLATAPLSRSIHRFLVRRELSGFLPSRVFLN